MRSRNLRSRLRLLGFIVLLAPVLLLTSSPGWAQTADTPSTSGAEPAASVEIPLDRWLVLGPAPVGLPAFHDEKGPSGKPVEIGDLLDTTLLELPEPWPSAGDTLTWVDGSTLTWREVSGSVELGSEDDGAGAGPTVSASVTWLVTYLEADRFLSGQLRVETADRARVWLDSQKLVEKSEPDTENSEETSAEEADAEKTDAEETDSHETGSASGQIHLTPGKHLLRVKVLHEDSYAPSEESSGSTFTARLELSGEDAGATAKSVRVGVSPRRGLTVDDLLDVDTVIGVSVSSDGDLFAVEWAHPSVPSEGRRSWVEIRRTLDGAPVREFRGAPEISGFTWGPGRIYAYVSRKDDKATVWVGELGEEAEEEGEVRAILRDVEHLGSVRFTPDSTSPRRGSLIYEISEEPPEGAGEPAKGVERRESLQDRWTGWRTKSYLHQVSLADGARRRLTAGALSTELQDLSPDGSRLLFSRTRYDPTQRPFSVTELWELALSASTGPSAEPRRLAEITWMNAARYSPDGETILVRAGPSAFGELGRNVPEGRIANEYDYQLYLLDRGSGEARAITREFDPSVQDAVWSRADGNVYLTAEDGSYVRLYRYRVADGSFEQIVSGVDVVTEMSLSAEASTLVYRGSSVSVPERVLRLNLAPDPASSMRMPPLVVVPPAERYAQIHFGRVEDWSFVMPATDAGEPETVIPGRIYYPPDFDPSRPEKWPLFVYYYGGTVPTSRGFGGRYPKNMWAAHGYVVYVLQPSGATGFGQEASSLHVNDWGRTPAKQILHGVETLLDERSYLDRDRVACFGGSFGGFMTMLLITESDLFTAAIAHAGISSISSYWGQGWWGYLYSAVATAGSYPWNRRDIYVDQSPLFRADKINTPLLLLHGTADPNVPPGESEQMYTALRLLGKEVELVTFEGQQHWILDEPKRRAWWQTILAWLDKYLKDQPQWWEHLWEGEGG
jgi:dipeptidyl aminopeptidase/acylaminoacyl peptidase